MGCVDRTAEFRQILREVSTKGLVPPAQGRGGPAPHAQSELSAMSAKLGRHIHEVSLKVHDLGKAARSRSIFNDTSAETQELFVSAKRDIQDLNMSIEDLEARAKSVGPNHSYREHASNMVATLKQRVRDVTRDFNAALKDRARALEEQHRRKSLYFPGAVLASDIRGEARPADQGADVECGCVELAGQRGQASRVDALMNVQRAVRDLAQMFQKVAVMVSAQDEAIQRIDADVTASLDNVEQGQQHLLRYFHRMSEDRRIILKVFIVLVFLAVFFVVFLA